MKPSLQTKKCRMLTDMAAQVLLGKPSPDDVARALAAVERAKEIRLAEAAANRVEKDAQ